VIRVKTTLVNSPVLVIGRDGKYVPTLRREDFQIFENGVKQDIAYFAPVEKPFTVALLIDTSRSTLFDLQDIEDAALAFVDKMRPNDQALIVTFADDVKVLAEATSDRDALRRSIRSLGPGGDTRIYDAIDFVIRERLDRITGRKAMIVFSDGVDTASISATYESSLQNVEKSETLIYPVQFSTYERMKIQNAPQRRAAPEGSGFSRLDYLRADAYLRRVAEGAGSALYPAYDISDLDRAIDGIVDELHNEYSLGYYPRTLGQPGEVRRLEVRTSRKQLVIRARTSYVVDQSGAVIQAPRTTSATTASVSAATGSLPTPRSFEGGRLPMGARWVCKGPNVPSDFGVVKEGFVSQCPKSSQPGDETNAWFIKKPGASEVLCKGLLTWNGRVIPGAPIPSGYVVSGELVSPVCAKSSDPKSPANAWSARLPGQRETVCKGFPIPRGYVVIDERLLSSCPAKTMGKNAWVIRPKS
jgi:VWFA-related protein